MGHPTRPGMTRLTMAPQPMQKSLPKEPHGPPCVTQKSLCRTMCYTGLPDQDVTLAETWSSKSTAQQREGESGSKQRAERGGEAEEQGTATQERWRRHGRIDP